MATKWVEIEGKSLGVTFDAAGRPSTVIETYRPRKARGWSKKRARTLWEASSPPDTQIIRDAITLANWSAQGLV